MGAPRCATIGCGNGASEVQDWPYSDPELQAWVGTAPDTHQTMEVLGRAAKQSIYHDDPKADPKPDQQCVGCGGVKPGLYDTTWDGVHIGHLCIGCINTGKPSLIVRRRKAEQEPDEFLRAMAFLGVVTVLSPFILFFAWWAMGVFN